MAAWVIVTISLCIGVLIYTILTVLEDCENDEHEWDDEEDI